MSNKKNKEKAIFDCVYSNRGIASFIQTEEPDFKVKNTDGDLFGVEITEFYFSHALARIRNSPDYLRKIITEKKLHKDDNAFLEVTRLAVIPSDNRRPKSEIDAVLQKRPTISEYVDKISDVIEKKGKLFEKYKTGLNHVNLIILDCESILNGTPKDKFHHLLFQPQLEKALMKEGFREVFFITRLGEYGSSKYVYIPLKMLFLVAEIFFFNNIIEEEYPNNMSLYSENKALLCAEYLTWRGAKNVYFKKASDGFNVAYGNTEVFTSKNNGITITDHDDSALPTDLKLCTTQDTFNIFNDAFSSLFEKYKRNHIFRGELCYEIHKDNLLAHILSSHS